MAYDFSVFNENGLNERQKLDEEFVVWLVNEKALDVNLHFEKLWSYYRNEMREISTTAAGAGQVSETARPYRQSQEYGLPCRITGVNYSFYGGIMIGSPTESIQRKEVVIENDIAWRIDTMVDFLFGKSINITSRAANKKRAQEIQQILNTVLDANGGATYLQQLAMLGSIYGFVDVILRWCEPSGGRQNNIEGGTAGTEPENFYEVLEKARQITLEAIEAPRSLPVLDENDYHQMNYYIQHYWQQHNELDHEQGSVQDRT